MDTSGSAADPKGSDNPPGLFFRHAGHRYDDRKWFYTFSFLFIQFFGVKLDGLFQQCFNTKKMCTCASRDKIVDFHWNASEPWTIVSVSDDCGSTGGGGTLQVKHVFCYLLSKDFSSIHTFCCIRELNFAKPYNDTYYVWFICRYGGWLIWFIDLRRRCWMNLISSNLKLLEVIDDMFEKNLPFGQCGIQCRMLLDPFIFKGGKISVKKVKDDSMVQ